MSEQNKAAGGSDPASGGDQGDKESKGMVSFESHEKLLKEKKKRDEELSEARKRLEALEAEQKAVKEAKLKENEDFKALLEAREKELADKDESLKSLKSKIEEKDKKTAFLGALSGDLPAQYHKLIDVSEVVLDAETGEPDQASVNAAVKKFETEYPHVLLKRSGAKLPNEAPRGAGKLTAEEWKKLPYKEKLERQKDVVL